MSEQQQPSPEEETDHPERIIGYLVLACLSWGVGICAIVFLVSRFAGH